MTDVLKPGIHKRFSYAPHHQEDISGVTYCGSKGRSIFVSFDEGDLTIWAPTLSADGSGQPKIKQVQCLPLPGGERGSITCLIYANKCNQYFAACLDDTLKLFDEQFRLQATFRWHGGVIRNIIYNPVYDELITSGRNGVKTWVCEPDYKAFAKNAAAPISARSSTKVTPGTSAAAFVTKLKGGKAPPWELGAFQSIRERATFRVPGVNQHRVPKPVGVLQQPDWCQNIFLQEDLQVVYVPVRGSVYGFRVQDGERINDWEDIHKQTITAVVHPPGSNHVITGSHDLTAKVWTLAQDSTLQLLQVLVQTAFPVESISLNPSNKSFLMALTDGSLTLWHLETLQELYQYKHDGPMHGLTFTEPDEFYFFSADQVCAMHIQHLFTSWRSCNSQPRQLALLENDSLLMSFEDGCVRLCDSESALDTMATLPQLSTRSPQQVRVDLVRKQLYVLLSNGHIHIWRMHNQKQPTLVAVWDKLTPNQRDHALCMSFMRGAALDPALAEMQGFAMADGLSVDHVAVGTRAGDCLFVDVRSGDVTVYFPAHRGTAIDLIEVDPQKQRVITVGGDMLKLWTFKGHRLIKEVRFPEKILHLVPKDESVVLGGDAGGIHILDFNTGALLVSPKMEDHEGPVTSISINPILQHFLSSGLDGVIKIFDDTKKLKRTLDLIEPVLAASWLNIEGDIVAALDRNLVVIRADTYQFLSQDEMVSLLAEHTKGMIPGAPQPASSRSSALQRQATLKQQLSMIPAALCDDFLTHLMTLSADARLSIFDVPPSRPEVSETAVVARVATAAKAWQRYRSAARGPLPNGPANATSDNSNPAAVNSKADSAAQLSSAEAKGDPCGSDRHASHAAASSSAATHVSSHAGKQKVGFGQGLAVDRQSASVQGSSRSSAAQHSGNRSAAHHTGQHDPGNVNMHMGIMNRAGGHSGQLMHDAIQSLNDELQQERHSWQTSASGGPHATLPADLTATPDLTLDTQKLVRADQQQDDQQQHAEQSEAGSDDSGASSSESSSDSEQGEIPGLSSFMAAALKVVSAPDAFMQTDKPFQPPLLPNFSFDKRGALVKTMSRKHSIFRHASDATAAATDLHAGTTLKATRRQSSSTSQQSDAAAATMVKTMSHKHSSSSQQFDGSAAAVNVPREAVLQLGRTTLAAIPEDMSVHGSTPRSQLGGSAMGAPDASSSSPRKAVVKKRRKKRRIKQSRLGQLAGMTDEEKSIWLFKHCQAQDIMLGLLEYQAVSSDSRLAGSSLVAKQSRKAADTPSSPIQHVKPPQVFQPGP